MVQSILLRVLGTIPAPLIFGAVFDASCILWQDTCGVRGSCFFYDKQQLALYMFGVCVGYKCFALVFMICAWKFYVPPKIDPDAIEKDVDGLSFVEGSRNDVTEMKTTKELNREFDRQMSARSATSDETSNYNLTRMTSRDELMTSQDDTSESHKQNKAKEPVEQLKVDAFFRGLPVDSSPLLSGRVLTTPL